jgi:Protein of unknown function/AsmA-like C-terminal region
LGVAIFGGQGTRPVTFDWLKNIRIRAHHVRWTGFATCCAALAVIFFVLGAFLRLLVGPVSLEPFNGTLAQAIAKALPGLGVRYDEAALEWSRDEGRINLVILGARVFDENRRIIAQAPKAEIGLAARSFFRGKIRIKRIALVGVQLTLVRDKTGSLRLGIDNDRERSNVLDRIRADLLKSKGSATTLDTFAVRDARLAFYDEGTGLFVVAPEANLQITTSDPEAHGALEASVDAQMEISGHRSHIIASMLLPRNNGIVKGDISATQLSLPALAANAKSFAFLKPFALTTDFSGSFTLENGTRLKYADFGLGASGTVSGLGPHPVHVKSLRIVARYDGDTGRLLIDDATLAGKQASAHLEGDAQLSFTSGDVLKQAAFDLTADRIAIDIPDVMGRSVTLAQAGLHGTYTPATEDIAISRAVISGGPLLANCTGHVTLGKNDLSPAVALDGKIAAIGIRDLLHYWPLKLGAGARDWIDRNVSAGRVGPIVLHTAIPAGAMQQPSLPENAVNMSFPIADATIAYIRGLTPLTKVNGSALLTGDTFKGEIASASVGPLTVSKAQVVIANLHVAGTPADITAHVEGQLPDVLALVDMKPLQYPTKFHISPQAAQGTMSSDLSFKVPTVHNVSIDQVAILVKSQVSNLVLGVGQHTKITGGSGNITIDNKTLHAVGDVAVDNAPLSIDWTETFDPKGPYSTAMLVKGTMDAAARTALGIDAGDFLSGPVGVTATLQGRSGVIQRAQISLDLTPATLTFDLVNFTKPAGTPASALLNARFDNGVLRSADVSASGPAMSVKGQAAFDTAGNLQHLQLPVVHAGALNDFALNLTQGPAGSLDVSVAGRSADGTALGRHNANTNPANANKPVVEDSNPFHIAARLDQLSLRDGVAISGFALDVSGLGDRPRAMTLSGTLTKSAKIAGTIAETSAGRQLSLNVADAGTLLKGLFGFDSVRGGTLQLNATMPPLGARDDPGGADYKGKLTIRDFRILNQGFLTRLFSAGSLGGLVDLMRGQGIPIDKLQAPFAVHGGVIDIRNATASGPSLGISADGYLDRRSNKLELRGALAPVYGLNSVLGAIPLLGNILVSKKGEGVIGMTYTASGNADQPDISVNPLSVLAPGIFRRIFEGGTPTAPKQAETAPQQQPE